MTTSRSPSIERDEVKAIDASTDPRQVLELWMHMAAGIYLRLLPLLPVMREAISADPSLGSLWRQNAIDARYAGTHAVATKLKHMKALPRGITVAHAADVMWAYASFDTAEALIVERGWSPAAYEAWTVRTFCAVFEID